MSSVYVINAKNDLDYSGAKEFGTLIPVTYGAVNIYNPTKMIESLETVLKNFEEGDYLLLSGNCLPVYVSVVYLMQNRPDILQHNILVYDVRAREYVAHTVNLEDMTFSSAQ